MHNYVLNITIMFCIIYSQRENQINKLLFRYTKQYLHINS